jgi:apolipoprotein N-acyltransferase
VVWLEPGRGITARLDKERAIPLLESSRRFLGDALLAPLFGEAAGWKRVEEARGWASLPGPIPVTPALCYEVLFPGIVARRRTPDSVAIVNLADDSWVEGTTATRQLTNLARFRAIEQRLTLVRVAHGGLSAVVDPFGRVIHELPLDRYASLRVSLSPMPPVAISERVAILALPLAAFGVVGWCWARWQRMHAHTPGEVP